MTTGKGFGVQQPLMALSGRFYSMHRYAREGTHIDRRTWDESIAQLDLSKRDVYARFLKSQYIGLSSLAGLWGSHDQAAFSDLLRCLVKDLEALDCRLAFPASAHRPREVTLRQWGTAYMIRGSRLSVELLRRRVLSTLPIAYVEHSLELSWGDFLQRLDHAAESMTPEDHLTILHGAKSAYGVFLDAL